MAESIGSTSDFTLAAVWRVARWTRGFLLILALLMGFGLLFWSRPKIESPPVPLRTGTSVVRVKGNLLSFLFRHQLRTQFGSSHLSDYDIWLSSRTGHCRADSSQPILLPVYPRDQVVINIAGPATGTVGLLEPYLKRTFLPGGWLILVLLGVTILLFHGLSAKGLTRQQLLKYLLAGTSTVACFVLLAVLAQVADLRRDRQERWQLFPPKMDRTLYVYPDIMPGVPEGVVHFKTSSDGIRARERWSNNWSNATTVLCIGASTTEGLFLGEENHWPRLLEKKLQQLKGTNVWVGNAGHGGYNTAQLARVARDYLPRIGPKHVVVFTGFNEGQVPGEPVGGTDLSARPRDWVSKIGYLVEKIAILHMGRQVLFSQISRSPNDVSMGLDNTGLVEARQKFQLQAKLTAPRERNWENLDLTEFEQSLRQIHASASQVGAKLVFCTAPALYRAEMTTAEQRLLWLMGNYTTASKRRRMDLINDRMRRIAAELGVPVADLDRELPRTTEAFYDDCHLNVRGAQMVADTVFRCIATNDP